MQHTVFNTLVGLTPAILKQSVRLKYWEKSELSDVKSWTENEISAEFAKINCNYFQICDFICTFKKLKYMVSLYTVRIDVTDDE